MKTGKGPIKRLLRGAKFNHRHSTVITEAVHILQVAKALPEVSKIVLSVVTPTGSGEPRLKFSPVSAGLKMQVRGRTAVQIFYVYSNNPAETQGKLEVMWKFN